MKPMRHSACSWQHRVWRDIRVYVDSLSSSMQATTLPDAELITLVPVLWFFKQARPRRHLPSAKFTDNRSSVFRHFVQARSLGKTQVLDSLLHLIHGDSPELSSSHLLFLIRHCSQALYARWNCWEEALRLAEGIMRLWPSSSGIFQTKNEFIDWRCRSPVAGSHATKTDHEDNLSTMSVAMEWSPADNSGNSRTFGSWFVRSQTSLHMWPAWIWTRRNLLIFFTSLNIGTPRENISHLNTLKAGIVGICAGKGSLLIYIRNAMCGTSCFFVTSLEAKKRNTRQMERNL